MDVFKVICQQYGSRFYQQEIINATNAVKNCSFFIAPFFASAQLACFYQEEVIQVAFGTSKLLCFERFDQAIVDFNLTQGTFSFIDRDDLKLANESRQSALAEYFFKSGAVNGFD